MTIDFYIGGYFHDHSYRLVLNNTSLSISDYVGIPIPEHDKVVYVDNNVDWNNLVVFLKGCNWKRRYDSEVLDGTQWEMKAQGEGVKVNAYGSNAYPENFDEFLMLLNRVISEVGVKIVK